MSEQEQPTDEHERETTEETEDGDGLQTKLTELQESLEAMRSEKEELSRKLVEKDDLLLTDEYLEFASAKRAGASDKVEDGVDLNTLSNVELAQHFQKQTQQSLQELREAHQKELADVRQSVAQQAAKAEISMLKAVDSQFAAAIDSEPGRKQFISIANENPSWDAQRIARQMRLESLDAAQEKQRKEDAKRAKSYSVLAAKDEVPLPTVNDKDLPPKEAGRKAYEAIFGGGGE